MAFAKYRARAVADPGFVKREGRKSKFDTFCPEFCFASFTLLSRGYVRLPDRDKKEENKNREIGRKNGRKGGGGAAADSAPLDPPRKIYSSVTVEELCN